MFGFKGQRQKRDEFVNKVNLILSTYIGINTDWRTNKKFPSYPVYMDDLEKARVQQHSPDDTAISYAIAYLGGCLKHISSKSSEDEKKELIKIEKNIRRLINDPAPRIALSDAVRNRASSNLDKIAKESKIYKPSKQSVNKKSTKTTIPNTKRTKSTKRTTTIPNTKRATKSSGAKAKSGANSKPTAKPSDIRSKEHSHTIFRCSSCGSTSRIPKNKRIIVTCPSCGLKETVGRSKTLSPWNTTQERKATNKSKNSNVLDSHSKNIPNATSTPSLSVDERKAKLAWLKENSEFFVCKKAKGEALSDYEQGLIDQYQAMLRDMEENSDEDQVYEGRGEDGTSSPEGESSSVERLNQKENFLKKNWEKHLREEKNILNASTEEIVVVGVGGGACELIDIVLGRKISGVGFIALDENSATLSRIACPNKITIDLYEPDEEKIELFKALLEDRKNVIVLVRLGGEYGTRMIQAIAGGIDYTSKTTTHLIATIPFQFEGIEKIRRAKEVLEECRERFGEIVVLDNQELFSQADEKTTFQNATEITATAIENYVLKLIRN